MTVAGLAGCPSASKDRRRARADGAAGAAGQSDGGGPDRSSHDAGGTADGPGADLVRADGTSADGGDARTADTREAGAPPDGPGNDPSAPRFLATPIVRHAVVGQPYSATVAAFAKDPAGSALTFSKMSGPGWLALAGDGRLGGTAGPADVGSAELAVRVTNAAGLWAQATIGLRVFAAGTDRVDRLKVMTFNAWGALTVVGDGVRKATEAIVIAGADVVAFQESAAGVTPVAARLGWPTAPASGASDRYVISRYPIVEIIGNPNDNGARIRLGSSQEVIVTSVHLDHTRYAPYRARVAGASNADVLAEERASGRDEQIAEVLGRHRDRLASADTVPFILCGDFNAPSHLDWTAANAAAHYGRVVVFPVSTALETAGLADSYRVAHPDPVADPGITWSPVFSARVEPQDRIDFIYFKGSPLSVMTSATFTTTVESKGHDYGVNGEPAAARSNTWPSDHAAVITTFRWSP